MAIPDYQGCMSLLRFYADGQDHTFREAVDALAKEFKLTDAEQREMLPSSRQGVFDNRVGRARAYGTYMKKAG